MTKRYNLFAGFEPFALKNVQLTGRKLGHGSYGTVFEVIYNGKKCAGKEIHEILLEQGDYSYTLQHFAEECRILSHLHHRNIVQFYGVYFKRKGKVPILVMELLTVDLTSYIEKHGILPEDKCYSILHDVACGLQYLHNQSPPIIHRDLSANNVLLTDKMIAKITDFGTAKMVSLSPLQASQWTETPGTPDYMPPEVMVKNPKYDTSVDVFSFGIMIIHILSGKWPKPQSGQIRMDGRTMIPISEADRRDVYLRIIGYEHPLMELIHKCIHNNPEYRVHVNAILDTLEAQMSSNRQRGEINMAPLTINGISAEKLQHATPKEMTDHFTRPQEGRGAAGDQASYLIYGSEACMKSSENGEDNDSQIVYGASFAVPAADSCLTIGDPSTVSESKDGKELEISSSIPDECKGKSKLPLTQEIGHRSGLKNKLSGIFTSSLRRSLSPLRKSSALSSAVDDPEEQQRRLHMVETLEGDEVVAVPRRKSSKHRTRKERKNNGQSSGSVSPTSPDRWSVSADYTSSFSSGKQHDTELSALDLDHTSHSRSLLHSQLSTSAEHNPRSQSLSLPTPDDELNASAPEHTGMLAAVQQQKELPDSSDSDNEREEDWTQLCESLLMYSKRHRHLFSAAEGKQTFRDDSASIYSFESPPLSPTSEPEMRLQSDKVTSPSATIWVPVLLPSKHNLLSISVSDKLLWAVDSGHRVYFMMMDNYRKHWHSVKKNMDQISSSSSGNNVWGVYEHNSCVRLGLGMNLEGNRWRNITKNTHLAHKIKQVAVDETSVWAITTDGKVLFRQEVGQPYPEGMGWQEVGHNSTEFSYIACCRDVVWAINTIGIVYCRTGISLGTPSGIKWKVVHVPMLMSVAITSRGVAWGVSPDNTIGFRCGVSVTKPSGTGPWWEVCIDTLTNPEPSASSQVGIAFFASPATLIDSLPLLGLDNKLSITASSKSGIVVLERGCHLHACLTTVTGFHYSPASEGNQFQSLRWSKLAASDNSLWLVSSDTGYLYSLTDTNRLVRVECPEVRIRAISASPTQVCIVSEDSIWFSSTKVPESLTFDRIELPHGIHLRHVACGRRTVWTVDSNGVPYYLSDVQSQERCLSVWFPVSGNPHPFLLIAVSPNDWLIWACDEKYNVYARVGVCERFPSGQQWKLIPERQAKELCADDEKIYAVTSNSELICRYGISKENVEGDYWRKMPGKYYEHISVGESGDLWTMDSKGCVWRQEWTMLKKNEQKRHSTGSASDWVAL